VTLFGHDQLGPWDEEQREAPFDAAITLLDDILRSVTASFELERAECAAGVPAGLGAPAADGAATDRAATDGPLEATTGEGPTATNGAAADGPVEATAAEGSTAADEAAADGAAATKGAAADGAPASPPPAVGPVEATFHPPARLRPTRETLLVAVDSGVALELQHWANHLGVDLGELIDEALRRHLGRLAGADGSPPATRHFGA
jgi:hypothetical protein